MTPPRKKDPGRKLQGSLEKVKMRAEEGVQRLSGRLYNKKERCKKRGKKTFPKETRLPKRKTISYSNGEHLPRGGGKRLLGGNRRGKREPNAIRRAGGTILQNPDAHTSGKQAPRWKDYNHGSFT